MTDEVLLQRFPNASIDHDNKEFYRGLLEHKLMVNRCIECRTWHFPPRSICPVCWSASVQAQQVSGRGILALFTVVAPGTRLGSDVLPEPRALAAMELVEQRDVRITMPLVNCMPEEIRIGMSVELTWIYRQGQSMPAIRPAE